jgi:putative membrane protein
MIVHLKRENMKKGYYFLGPLIFAVLSCGNNDQSGNTAQSANDSNQAKIDSSRSNQDTSTISASVTEQDSKFATDAATIGMMEIALGKVAEQNAMRQDVKDFGAMMVKDHTSAADELNKIAEKKHIVLPTSLSAFDQKKVDDMKAKTGNNFDKDYISMMVSGHKKAADEFNNEIKQGSDGDLRAFATKTLDVIKKHLQAAEKCKDMEK